MGYREVDAASKAAELLRRVKKIETDVAEVVKLLREISAVKKTPLAKRPPAPKAANRTLQKKPPRVSYP
jgi:hypothetical protein